MAVLVAARGPAAALDPPPLLSRPVDAAVESPSPELLPEELSSPAVDEEDPESPAAARDLRPPPDDVAALGILLQTNRRTSLVVVVRLHSYIYVLLQTLFIVPLLLLGIITALTATLPESTGVKERILEIDTDAL